MKHLILIGYKNVGKSAIGRKLAQAMGAEFIDLDEVVEKTYAKKNGAVHTCREIMNAVGQDAFHELEHEALQESLSSPTFRIISLGGGTPLFSKNKILMQGHTIVQITAPKEVVFERIMANGKPAFFSAGDPLESFNRTWKERGAIYDSLTDIKIDNSGSLDEAVKIIIAKTNLKI